MVEAADADTPPGFGLRLVLQLRRELGRCLVPGGLVVERDLVTVGIGGHPQRADAGLVADPVPSPAGRFDGRRPALQRLGGGAAQRGPAEPGTIAARDDQAVMFVVVPGTQVDVVAVALGDGQAEKVGEERDGVLEARREQLCVPEMGDVAERRTRGRVGDHALEGGEVPGNRGAGQELLLGTKSGDRLAWQCR
ncbi:hypothetical protein BJY18_000661 [Amycolatopsis jiangsuensis]|uniref:Uncharacterized protein n=1 Tax=Amycolatopsis jiangsuensis TaxID=1181879 RepID=A0A840ILI4_9PSEU|nr:hypothetical protein [Amycolatopsis jiangsuensis]MBB4683176.1 hypothetical protein [Amycolatopsis jiangsuensis]